MFELLCGPEGLQCATSVLGRGNGTETSRTPLETWDVVGLCLGVTASTPGEMKSWSGQVSIAAVVVLLPPYLGTVRNRREAGMPGWHLPRFETGRHRYACGSSPVPGSVLCAGLSQLSCWEMGIISLSPE